MPYVFQQEADKKKRLSRSEKIALIGLLFGLLDVLLDLLDKV